MASSHRRPLEDEDVPPPPYSETDIYSTSGRGPVTPTSSFVPIHHDRRNSNHTDNDDIISTTTTSNGEIIYTPPLTPRSSQSNSNSLPAFHSAEGSTATEAAYAAYFEDRPAPAGLSTRTGDATKIITVTVWEDTSPHEIPFPDSEGLEARDVTLVDWQTFTNFLLGNAWDARRNEEALRRKEASDVSNGGSVKEAGSRGSASPTDDAERAEERRAELEKTVREWNSGFFAPRGVIVVARVHQHAKEDNRRPQGMMPGSWGNGCAECERAQREQQQQQQPPPLPSHPQPYSVSPPNGSRERGPGFFGSGLFNTFGGGNSSPGSGGFNFAGIKIDGDKVSIGDRFVADGRAGSLKIGGIAMDSTGISINGNPMFGGHGRGGGRGGSPWCPPRGGMAGCPPMMGGMHGGWPFGGPGGGRMSCGGPRGETGHHHWGRGGRGSWWGSASPWQTSSQSPTQPQPYVAPTQSQPQTCGVSSQPQSQPQPQPQPQAAQEKREPEPERGRGHRGRHSHRGSRHRSRSSSTSSVSSSSSSSSESSAGSLPDYDDLKDSQLPIVKQYLQASLQRPDQMITKEKIKEAKQQIREARKNPPSDTNEPVNIGFDRKELKRQIKELMREWKQLKKEQKRRRRQLRKEKRNRRKEEKRERRNTRREVRRAERDFHRNLHHHHHDRHRHFYHDHNSANQQPQQPFVIPRVPVPNRNIPAPFAPMDPVPRMPTLSSIPTPPGAWPPSSPAAPPPVPSGLSAAKYKAADEVSEQLAAREAELVKLHESIAVELENSPSGSGPGSSWPSAEKEKEVLKMEREIEELGVSLEKLRTEADEEFARELAMEEERQEVGLGGIRQQQEEGFRALNWPGI